jgi:hypothetical protein
MTDPITAGIIVVLSKYVIDQGAELIKEVGPAAAKKAGELLKTALDHLRGSPKGELVAGAFEEDPQTYEKPLAKELETAVQADPDLAARLEALWAEYQEAANAHAVITSYQANVKGGGAVAQGQGATAVGSRGINIGGNVGGPIITGSGNVIHTGRSPGSSVTLPPTLAPLRDKLARYFNRSELKGLCFDLGVAYDDLPGETRTELAQALVEHCHQRGRLPELLRRCQVERPHVDWTLS